MSAQANGLGEPPTQTKLSPNGAALNTTTPCIQQRRPIHQNVTALDRWI